ncbi:hypothetical protein AB0L82_26145 [Nocardia sp. NPDC052001]|uniref:hypothetical protein n=1 Tax=Nocardia sp. NPDC052001 TaxID=3154853 RepID=UPI00341F604C
MIRTKDCDICTGTGLKDLDDEDSPCRDCDGLGLVVWTDADERAQRWAKGTKAAPTLDWESDLENWCMDALLVTYAQCGLDRIDTKIGEYHASRVPDPAEAQWRTDYTRAHMRVDLALDQPWPEHPDAAWLYERAAEIEQHWIADPEVAPRWRELRQLWIETGAFIHPQGQLELPTIPGETPPGMDPVTWRSQAQARDLSGHGRWSAITTKTTDREDTEPMNDITQPEPFTPAEAGETETRMRADFVHAWSTYEGEYDPADAVDYGDYANRWMSDPEWVEEWCYLQDATLRHEDNRDPERLTVDVDLEGLSPIERRSEEQARYMAEHGVERDGSGGVVSPYITRADALDRPTAGALSALAEFKPGNALAADAATSEHDGFER